MWLPSTLSAAADGGCHTNAGMARRNEVHSSVSSTQRHTGHGSHWRRQQHLSMKPSRAHPEWHTHGCSEPCTSSAPPVCPLPLPLFDVLCCRSLLLCNIHRNTFSVLMPQISSSLSLSPSQAGAIQVTRTQTGNSRVHGGAASVSNCCTGSVD